MNSLEKLFVRHFVRPGDALRAFHDNLRAAKLPFDVLSRLRELEFPGYPSFHQGMPSFIYYFLPGTRWGTFGKQALKNPTEPDFVYGSDGIGLNLGCPVRLARALEILFSLPDADRQECLEGLSLPTKHFATVEELLWLSIWSCPTDIRRGGVVPGVTTTKNVDWLITLQGNRIYLESKFRPADWPRLTDQSTHRPMDGFLLGKASEQFPKKPNHGDSYLVALTGFAEPNDYFASICKRELSQQPHIHGILFRTMLGPTHIFTNYELVLRDVFPLLNQEIPSENFPAAYSVQFHRQQRADRIAARRAQAAVPSKSFSIHYGRVMQLPAKTVLKRPKYPYRLQIARYTAEGEPEFRVITPFIRAEVGA